jgi:hypothetical protein
MVDAEIRSDFPAGRAYDRLRPGERIMTVENRFDDGEIVTRRVIADERLSSGSDFSEPPFEFVSVLDLNESQVATLVLAIEADEPAIRHDFHVKDDGSVE